MKGVEILDTSSTINTVGVLWFLFCVLISAVCVVFAILTIIYIFEQELIKSVILSILTIVSFTLIIYSKYKMDKNDIPKYQVTISDEVKMVDFMDKYDIIETNGKIYTVTEKEK